MPFDLYSALPAPKQSSKSAVPAAGSTTTKTITTGVSIPPYGQRKGYKPRAEEDFGDGGAFPEIHIPQFPLGMGKTKESNGKTLALQVDAAGQVRYDAVVRQGHDKNRTVHSQFQDLIPMRQRADAEGISLDRPDEEEVKESTERTRAALEKIVSGKIAAAQPSNVGKKKEEPNYIRYTPGQQSEGHNSGSKQRIIRMTEMPVDPMQPPKFKHTKVPKAPPSPPAPVMHSPPRKMTAQEQKDWVIPPCVSNWKNPKGYTIALETRLAADGRGLQEVTINDRFAHMAEALNAADRHAREEIRQRALMQQRLAQREKAAKEENLRALAQRAREERAGAIAGTSHPGNMAADDEDALRERQEIRREREQDREREIRMSKMGTEQKAKHLARLQGRDISEKIALGLAKPTTSKESMFDQRLYNQSAGLNTGFRDEEAYDVYDKPLFNTGDASSIYRPKTGADSDKYGSGNKEDIGRMLENDRFSTAGLGSSREFQGAGQAAQQQRDGPVQFEKEEVELNPFTIDQYLSEVKEGKRKLDDSNSGRDRSKRTRD